MQANEFEKQVQQQLDEFQLTPSASVWQSVEDQIRKRRKRRLIFFILLPIALGLMGVSIFYFRQPAANLAVHETSEPEKLNAKRDNPQSPNHSTPANTDELKPSAGHSNTNGDVKDRAGVAVEEIEPASSASISEKKIKANSTTKFGTINSTVTQRTIREEDQSAKQKPGDYKVTRINQPNHTPADPANNRNSSAPENNNVANKANTSSDPQGEPTVKSPVLTSHASNGIQLTGDSLSRKRDSVAVDTLKAAALKHIETQTNEPVVAKKIKWGITASVGSSGVHDGFSLFATAQAADMSAPPTTGSGTGGPTSVIPPSTARNGFGFSTGVVAEYGLSKRISLSAGLQYRVQGTRITTGQSFDTVLQVQGFANSVRVNQVYAGTQQHKYTNRYHFISVPVELLWQLNTSSARVGFVWSTGFDLSYLVSTNGLLYSSSYGGIYYQDKSAYNKMHVNLATGLALRGGKGRWMAGPSLRIDATPLLKNGSKRSLVYGGLDMRFMLSKKK